MLTPARRAQRVRRHAGPGRRRLPARPHRGRGAGRAALPAGDAGPGDDLAGPRRLDRGPGRHVHRPLVPPAAPVRDPPAAPNRLRGRAHPAPHGEVHHRQRRAEPGLRAGVQLRPHRGPLGVLRPGLWGGHRPRRRGRRPAAAGHRPQSRLRGPRRPRPDHPARGRPGLRRPVLATLAVVGLRGVLGRAGPAGQRRRGVRADGADLGVLAGLDQPGRVPRAPLAEPPPAQRPDPQGPDLRAHRGAAGGGDHLAARDARRLAQLRLPLHLDPRRHLHALGPVHPRVRARGQRLLLLRGRRLRRRGRRAPDHVRGRGRAGAARGGARAPERVRGRPAGPDRQRRRHPAPARRLGGGARLGLPAHQVPRLPARAGLADAEAGRRVRDRATGASPTRGSGRSGARPGTSPPPS